MKIMKTISLFAAACFFCIQTAHGALLLEPMAGFALGDGEQGTTEYSYSSPFFGGRVGFQNLGLMVGGDFRLYPEFDLDNDTAGTTTEYDQSRLGAFIGYELPVMLRFWATYYFNNDLENKSDGAGSGFVNEGSGYGLGVGWTGLPFLSLNLEYIQTSRDEVERTDGTTSNLDPDLDLNEIVFSVSFPFSL